MGIVREELDYRGIEGYSLRGVLKVKWHLITSKSTCLQASGGLPSAKELELQGGPTQLEQLFTRGTADSHAAIRSASLSLTLSLCKLYLRWNH
jgi:hypothetical protein